MRSVDHESSEITATSGSPPSSRTFAAIWSRITSRAGQPRNVGVNSTRTRPSSTATPRTTPRSTSEITGISGSGISASASQTSASVTMSHPRPNGAPSSSPPTERGTPHPAPRVRPAEGEARREPRRSAAPRPRGAATSAHGDGGRPPPGRSSPPGPRRRNRPTPSAPRAARSPPPRRGHAARASAPSRARAGARQAWTGGTRAANGRTPARPRSRPPRRRRAGTAPVRGRFRSARSTRRRHPPRGTARSPSTRSCASRGRARRQRSAAAAVPALARGKPCFPREPPSSPHRSWSGCVAPAGQSPLRRRLRCRLQAMPALPAWPSAPPADRSRPSLSGTHVVLLVRGPRRASLSAGNSRPGGSCAGARRRTPRSAAPNRAGRPRARRTPRGGRTAPARRPPRTTHRVPRSRPHGRRAAPCAPAGRPRKPSRRFGEDGAADPLGLRARGLAQLQPLLRHRAVTGDDVFELVPVRLGELPDAVVVLAQLRVRNGQPQLPDLRDVAVEELLARLAVALALDPPDIHRVVLGRNRVPVELHERPPPPVQRLLHHLVLLVPAVHNREDHVAAVEDVERLFPADLLHDPRVRRVRALEERLLADDRRGVHEPGDHADVAPRLRRVVEDVVELRLARDQVGEALLARLPEVLDDAVDQLRVADLVLHLRGERELPLERRSTEDPLPLRQDAHELGVPMHLDELDQLGPVILGHRVVGLDLSAGLHVLEEFLVGHLASETNDR